MGEVITVNSIAQTQDPRSPHITGRTRVLGILAHPIDHVKAPPGINRIASARGRNAVMVPFNVEPADLGTLVAALRVMKSFDGAIVTVPHKQSIIPLCDIVSDRARAVGAANILRREPDGRLAADQLDGIGFVSGLRAQGIEIAGRRVHLTGAGGAASAIAFALAEGGAARLTLHNRSRPKIEALRDGLRTLHPAFDVQLGDSDPTGNDIIVNGTTLGMKPGDPLPIDVAMLRPGMVVAEVVMEPAVTSLLAAAETAGCIVHAGHHMLDHQLKLMAAFMGL